jgi:hypothetical protein
MVVNQQQQTNEKQERLTEGHFTHKEITIRAGSQRRSAAGSCVVIQRLVPAL